jgi:hypothetical protein
MKKIYSKEYKIGKLPSAQMEFGLKLILNNKIDRDVFIRNAELKIIIADYQTGGIHFSYEGPIYSGRIWENWNSGFWGGEGVRTKEGVAYTFWVEEPYATRRSWLIPATLGTGAPERILRIELKQDADYAMKPTDLMLLISGGGWEGRSRAY